MVEVKNQNQEGRTECHLTSLKISRSGYLLNCLRPNGTGGPRDVLVGIDIEPRGGAVLAASTV